MRLEFEHARGGLHAAGDSLVGFELAGRNRVFHPANAAVEDRSVVAWSDRAPAPAAVRYAWGDCPTGNLVNGAGLPASPFRTDNWDRWRQAPAAGVDEEARGSH